MRDVMRDVVKGVVQRPRGSSRQAQQPSSRAEMCSSKSAVHGGIKGLQCFMAFNSRSWPKFTAIMHNPAPSSLRFGSFNS